MPKFDYNIVVIGGGSAGLVTSYIAAAVKAKVALIERHKMGGDCLNTGCVPSKALIRSAKFIADMKRANEFGIKNVDYDFDFKDVMKRVHNVIKKIEPHDSMERYRSLGVDCFAGEAKIIDKHTVQIKGDKIITAKNIVVATGARPFVPEIPGIEESGYLTSDTLWDLQELPKKMVVLGGGPIGCEMAQSFARFGSKVTLVEMEPRILMREDNDVGQFMTKILLDDGVEIKANHKAIRFENKKIITEHNGKEVVIDFDEILIAIGRKANVTGFGLEELGVKVNQGGTIDHDQFLRTTVPNIFVCGDVAGPYQFTHMAAHQAWYAAVNALFNPFKKFKVDYSVVPWATYTDPELAHVGHSEKTAQALKLSYDITKYNLKGQDRAVTEGDNHGFVKILTKKGSDKIIGATIIGPHGGDLICELVLAMKHGIGLNKILSTIHPYPTLAEMNKATAGLWKQAHAPEWALSILRKFHHWRR